MDREWLREELEKPGRSQSALARFMGYSSSAIVNRIVQGSRRIALDEVPKIETYLAATARGEGVLKFKSAPKPVHAVIQPTGKLPVLGEVAAGVWHEVDAIQPAPHYLDAPDMGPETFALKVVGNSMNLVYPDGCFIIVRKWQGGPLPIGRRVVVKRERPGGLYETTVKELVEDSDGDLHLWPRSDDPRFQSPVPFQNNGHTVELIGLVTGKLELEG